VPWLAWLYRRATAGSRPLPDFLIIGAHRCGTSWTYSRLTLHPSIVRAWRKEVHFFDSETNFARGPGWYRAHFHRVVPGMVTGEATPGYIFDPAAMPRIAALMPRARLVALLRDPVDRAYSAYRHRRRHGREAQAFEAALDAECEATGPPGHGYLARGLYADQLARVFECFPREQVLIVRSADLFERPAEQLAAIMAFLGLPPAVLPLRPPAREARYEPMSAPTRARLVGHFRPHNARLYELLGRDLGFAR
jgi:hypothetical protein